MFGVVWFMVVGSNRITPCSICNRPIVRVKRIKTHKRFTVYSVLGDCSGADKGLIQTSMCVSPLFFRHFVLNHHATIFDLLCKEKRQPNIEVMGQDKSGRNL